MDTFILLLAAKLGVDPALLPVYLGVIVAVANLIGKSIPASAIGPLAILRKIALVIGLYVPQKITPTVTTKTVAKAIASEVPDSTLVTAARALPASVGDGVGTNIVANSLVNNASAVQPFAAGAKRARSRTTQSHWIAAILGLGLMLLLMGCTAAQQQRVESTVNTICTSAPLAQALYNTAVASGDHNRVNQVLNYLQTTCPAVVVLIQAIPVREPVTTVPVVAVGERG